MRGPTTGVFLHPQWLKERVHGDPERVVQQFRDYASHERRVNFKTRVCVAFDQINFELRIDHEIVSENLKGVPDSRLVNFVEHCSEGVSDQALHPGKKVPHKVHMLFGHRNI